MNESSYFYYYAISCMIFNNYSYVFEFIVGEINIHEAENLMVNTGGGQGDMHVKSVQANEGL